MGFNIRKRYSSAVHSHNLTVKSAKNTAEDAETTIGDPEVLGAFAWADRNLTRGHDGRGRSFKPSPLAVPLERLFAGDHRAAHEIVRILAKEAFIEARRTRVQLRRVQAHDMARGVLAWFRHGTCQPCGGRGFPLIKDSPVKSANECDSCGGTGKIAFDACFRHEWKPLARWLKEQIEMESGRAGPAAMKTLSERMDL